MPQTYPARRWRRSHHRRVVQGFRSVLRVASWAAANSGLKYFITEERAGAIGHEYQLIDDAALGYAKPGSKHQTASFYDVLAPLLAATAPAWPVQSLPHRGRRPARQHWLNGLKTLEYELGSERVMQAVAASKFKDVAGFGTKIEGHLLQDHGGEIWFRNLKLRGL